MFRSQTFALAVLILAVPADADVPPFLRILNWNVGNKPNSAADLADLNAVLSYTATLPRGTSAGRPPDILMLAETDSASSASLEATRAAMSSTFGVSYTAFGGTTDGGGDQTAVIFRSDTLSIVGSTGNVGGITHPAARAELRPVGSNGWADLHAYAVHLKSGSTSADEDRRLAEAQTIRADLTARGGRCALVAGDFNLTGPDERGAALPSAFDALIAEGAGQLRDAAGLSATGTWRDNPAILSLHTNAPNAAMDDRFDLQLFGLGLQDGIGLDYAAGSYRVVGNDGTHTLNQPITTGTGAPSTILAALARFSDHLPVLADYQITPVRPGDATLDGAVDFADLLAVASSYNAAGDWTAGDFTADGTVGFADLLLLAGNYNTVGMSDVPEGIAADWARAMSMVPEPSGLLVVAILGATAATRRRRR